MKRTFQILLLFFLQLLVSIALIFNPGLIIELFFLDMMIFFFLLTEPYWKKGAWLSFMVFCETIIFFLDLVAFNGIHFWKYTNILFNLFGLIIVLVAHIMRISEKQENETLPAPDEEFPDIDKVKKYIEKEEMPEEEQLYANDEPIYTNKPIDPEMPDVKAYIYTPKDNKIHLEECSKLQEYDEEGKLVIGSKRYAESKKYDPCEVCRPF